MLDFDRTPATNNPADDDNEQEESPAETGNKRKRGGKNENPSKRPKKLQLPKKRIVAPFPLTEAMTESQRIAAWKRRWNEPPSKVYSVFPKQFNFSLSNKMQELQEADVVERLRYLRGLKTLSRY